MRQTHSAFSGSLRYASNKRALGGTNAKMAYPITSGSRLFSPSQVRSGCAVRARTLGRADRGAGDRGHSVAGRLRDGDARGQPGHEVPGTRHQASTRADPTQVGHRAAAGANELLRANRERAKAARAKPERAGTLVTSIAAASAVALGGAAWWLYRENRDERDREGGAEQLGLDYFSCITPHLRDYGICLANQEVGCELDWDEPCTSMRPRSRTARPCRPRSRWRSSSARAEPGRPVIQTGSHRSEGVDLLHRHQ